MTNGQTHLWSHIRTKECPFSLERRDDDLTKDSEYKGDWERERSKTNTKGREEKDRECERKRLKRVRVIGGPKGSESLAKFVPKLSGTLFVPQSKNTFVLLLFFLYSPNIWECQPTVGQSCDGGQDSGNQPERERQSSDQIEEEGGGGRERVASHLYHWLFQRFERVRTCVSCVRK